MEDIPLASTNAPEGTTEPCMDNGPPSGNNKHRPTKFKGRKPPKEPRPSHFLALRLSHHSSVTSTLEKIQNSIVSHSPHLVKSMVDSASAHLTLGVLHLPDEATKEAASATLQSAAERAALEAPCSIKLRGLGHFRSEVLFLEIDGANGGREAVLELAKAVRSHFKEQGLLLQAEREFVPHVTVAKLSKMQPWKGRKQHRQWKKGKKKEHSNGEADAAGDEERACADNCLDQEEAGYDGEQVEEQADESVNSKPRKEEEGEKEAGKTDNKPERLIIPPESYSEHVDICIDDAVEVLELQLCAMDGRQQGEYYKIVHSVKLVQEWEKQRQEPSAVEVVESMVVEEER